MKVLTREEYAQVKILEKIKAEIKNIKEPEYDYEGFYCCNEILKIVENYIAELKGETNDKR